MAVGHALLCVLDLLQHLAPDLAVSHLVPSRASARTEHLRNQNPSEQARRPSLRKRHFMEAVGIEDGHVERKP